MVKKLVISVALIIIGRLVSTLPLPSDSAIQTAQALNSDSTNTISLDQMQIPSVLELKSMGITDQQIKEAGFIGGMSKLALKYAQEKQKYEQRYRAAADRSELASRMGKKVTARDRAIIEEYQDRQKKNKKPRFTMRNLFGNTLMDTIDYYRNKAETSPPTKEPWQVTNDLMKQIQDYFNPPLPDPVKQTTGEVISIGGAVYLIKVLAPVLIPLL